MSRVLRGNRGTFTMPAFLDTISNNPSRRMGEIQETPIKTSHFLGVNGHSESLDPHSPAIARQSPAKRQKQSQGRPDSENINVLQYGSFSYGTADTPESMHCEAAQGRTSHCVIHQDSLVQGANNLISAARDITSSQDSVENDQFISEAKETQQDNQIRVRFDTPNPSMASTAESESEVRTAEHLPKSCKVTRSSSLIATHELRGRKRKLSMPEESLPVVAFTSLSNINKRPHFVKFLQSKKGKMETNISDQTTILCVGSKGLRKTLNLITAVARGLDVVTDQWLTDSSRNGYLLDPTGYLPDDSRSEASWKFNLREAIERGKTGLKVLAGQRLFITASLSKALGKATCTQLQKIAYTAGAEEICTRLPSKGPKETAITLILGAENDRDASQLTELGWSLYSKDILALSILRGTLDLTLDEFKLHHGVTPARSQRKR